jgi:Bacterial PH domain
MTFSAPWGWPLKLSTALACVVVGVPAVYQLSQGRATGVFLGLALLATLPFIVRGYTLTAPHLEIHRLGWTTRWPLDGLREASARPGAMARSWRLWGNGGLFAIHGWFSNGPLGRYRAFVTDPDRTVVLWLPTAVLVVSPGDPESFVRALMARVGTEH